MPQEDRADIPNKRPKNARRSQPHPTLPGHIYSLTEGDLVVGPGNSGIVTLVERSSRSTILVHLPRLEGWGEKPPVKNGPSLGGYGAVAMNAALTTSMTPLPEQLRKTLTWDRGKELSAHAQFALDTGTKVFFADPHSPCNDRPTRTRMVYCASIFRRELTFRAGPPRTSKLSLWRSTTAPASSTTGEPRPRSSPNSYAHCNSQVLHRPVEVTQYTSIAFTDRLIEAGFDASIGATGSSYDCQSVSAGLSA